MLPTRDHTLTQQGFSAGCTSATPDDIEEYVTSTTSGLTYDAAADQYNYVWKTTSTWAGSCRQLVVKFVDGKEYVANFQFVK